MAEIINVWEKIWDSKCPKCHRKAIETTDEIPLLDLFIVKQFSIESYYLCLECETMFRIHNLELLDGRKIQEPISDLHVGSEDGEFTSADFGFLSDRQFVRSVERIFLDLLNGIKELKAKYNIETNILDVARNDFIARLLDDLARRFGIDRKTLNEALEQRAKAENL
jgi:hypothetical protein